MATPFNPLGRSALSRLPNRIAWMLQALLILVFGAAGAAKLLGVEQMVDLFGQLGVGQWFRYVTGAIEISSALLLLSPRTAWVGSAFLVCTMIGAIFVHLVVIPGSPSAAAVLGVLAVVVLVLRRPPL